MIQLRSVFFFLVIFSVILLSFGQQNYCQICANHTMCLYNSTTPVCSLRSTGLNFFQRIEVLTVHNSFRRGVASGDELRGNPGPQPRAQSMPSLSWDSELATIAQRWANQCNTQSSDACRNVARFQVGQNIASLWSRGSLPSNILTRLITLWYDEVIRFDSNQVASVTNFNGVGHYTQMLWAQTLRVGCGYINYQENNRNRAFLVCNYGPAGNINGSALYQIRD